MANKKYKLTDGNMWATDGIHDFGQNKTQRTINSEVNSALGGKAPTNHASTATTYGAASTSNYGHVKLSNTTPSMDGTAAVGDSTDVARANHVHPSDTSRVPTSRKVNNKQLSSDITLAASDVGAAPTDHASTATTYGKGTSSNYGHVKISDSLTDTTPAATGGVVPSMKAVSDLNGAIDSIEHAIGAVVDGDTCSPTGVYEGAYVYVKNNTHGLADGMYIAKTAFPTSGGTANSSVFEAASYGAMNSATSNKVGVPNTTYINSDSYSVSRRFGRIAVACGSNIKPSQNITGNTEFITGLDPAYAVTYFPIISTDGTSIARAYINSSGAIHIFWSTMATGKEYYFNASYITQF